MLEVIRESFREGLRLTDIKNASRTVGLCLATRQQVAIQADEGSHTSLLRGPAWDAQLSNIDPAIVRRFQADRARLGGFVLLVQTPEWEFLNALEGPGCCSTVGPVMPRSLPMPPTEA
jgi:hypothetical protein